MKIKKFPLNDNFIKIPVAHRGLHTDKIAENSLLAIKNAVESGYGVEIDVHLLADGKLAVVHDSNLKRVTGKEVIVETLTSEQLKEYKLWDGQDIPLFDQVLELIDGRSPLLIELKFDNKFDSRQAAAVLKRLESYPYPDKIALQSFHPAAVKYLKENTDKYAVGFLCSYKLGNRSRFVTYVLKSLKLYNKMHSDFISYDINFLPNKYVDKLRRKGEQLLCWTVNSKEKLERAKPIVDNIIFEKIKPE